MKYEAMLLLIGIISLSVVADSTYAATGDIPEYLRGGGDAARTLSRFMSGALGFLTSLLWGVWALFAVLFAKDLMVGTDAESLKGRAFKLGAAALVLLMITALPALFAGFVS